MGERAAAAILLGAGAGTGGGGRSCSPRGGRRRGRKGRDPVPGSSARLSLGARASPAERAVFEGRCRRRALARGAAATAAAAAAAVGLGRRLSRAGRGAGGEGGGGEGGGPGGKMPLAQLADPWQKMAVESPSDSAEVSAAWWPGPARPLLSTPPAGFPLRSWPLGPFFCRPLVPSLWDSGSGSWGWCVCPSLPPTLARGAVVWWRVGFGVGAGALQEADFNQLCVGEAGGGVGSCEELGSLALRGWGLPWTLVALGYE